MSAEWILTAVSYAFMKRLQSLVFWHLKFWCREDQSLLNPTDWKQAIHTPLPVTRAEILIYVVQSIKAAEVFFIFKEYAKLLNVTE